MKDSAISKSSTENGGTLERVMEGRLEVCMFENLSKSKNMTYTTLTWSKPCPILPYLFLTGADKFA